MFAVAFHCEGNFPSFWFCLQNIPGPDTRRRDDDHDDRLQCLCQCQWQRWYQEGQQWWWLFLITPKKYFIFILPGPTCMTTVHGTGTGRAPGVEGELQVSSLTFKSFNNQIDQPSTHWQCSPHPGQKAVWRTGTSHSQDWTVAHWNQRSPPCHRCWVSHSLCSHQGSQVPSLPGQTLPTPPLSAQSHPNRILLHPPASSHCNHPPDTVFSTELCWLWPTYKNEQVSAIKTNLLQKKYIGPKPQVKLSKVLKLFCQKKKHNKIRKCSLQRSVQILRGEDDQQKERPGEKEVKKLTRQDMKSNQDSWLVLDC